MGDVLLSALLVLSLIAQEVMPTMAILLIFGGCVLRFSLDLSNCSATSYEKVFACGFHPFRLISLLMSESQLQYIFVDFALFRNSILAKWRNRGLTYSTNT
jgi:hypothetical protein